MDDLATYSLLLLAIIAGWLLGSFAYKKNSKLEEKPRDIFQDYFVGLNYLLNDEPDEAIDTFIKALEINNDSVDTHLALGTLLRRRGKVGKAIKVHLALLARSGLEKSYSNMVSLELATDYISAGLLDRAERLLNDLVTEKGKMSQQALRRLVTIYQLENEWSKAIGCCETLLSFKKNRFDAELNSSAAHFCCELADESLHKEQLYEAKREVKRALTFDRKSVRASFILASIEQKTGNYAAATKELLRIKSNRPEFLSEIIEPLFECYKQQKKLDVYENFLQSCISQNHQGDAIVKLAELKQASAGVNTAIDFLKAQLQSEPSVGELLALLKMESQRADKNVSENLNKIQTLIVNYLRSKSSYRCNDCGFESKQLYWQCPSCKKWDKTLPMEAIAGFTQLKT